MNPPVAFSLIDVFLDQSSFVVWQLYEVRSCYIFVLQWSHLLRNLRHFINGMIHQRFFTSWVLYSLWFQAGWVRHGPQLCIDCNRSSDFIEWTCVDSVVRGLLLARFTCGWFVLIYVSGGDDVCFNAAREELLLFIYQVEHCNCLCECLYLKLY